MMRLTLYSSIADQEKKASAAPELPSPGERMAVSLKDPPYYVRSTVARMIFAVVCVSLSLAAGVTLVPHQAEFFQDLRLLCLFLAIVACSAYGGIVSGLLGTVLAYTGAVCFRRYGGGLAHGLSPADSALLAAQGIAVNLIGWALDVARSRARRKDADVRKLQRQILEVGDEERQRIGHDLHDGLGQQLTGISLLSESLAQRAAAGIPPTAVDFERVTRVASEAVRQTRDLARSLSPLTLEHEGFVAAMEELCETARVLFDVNCRWDYDGGNIPLDPKRAVHLYRIVQEAVSNSVKHGKATHVTIRAILNDNDLTLIVTDDGSGLSRKTITNPGIGLRTMAYRARIVGAELTAERAGDNGGTIVRCTCRVLEAPALENQIGS
jgi:signal transduction histidine kinase